MNAHPPVEIAGRTETGRVRERNEDSIAWDASSGIAVLADGMGGHRAGDVASELAVSVVLRALQGFSVGRGDARAEVRAAVDEANDVIFREARAPSRAGMGTTVDVVAIRGTMATIGHVGDSRVYLWSGGRLTQLTRDHSMVQDMIDRGAMTKAEARHSPARNVITDALGLDEAVRADVFQHDLMCDDLLLLCSDGLTDMLEDGVIADLLAENGTDPDRAAEALVIGAVEAGGRDNVSVVLVRTS